MIQRHWPALVVIVAGCGGFGGEDSEEGELGPVCSEGSGPWEPPDYFALDGQRSWSYLRDGDSAELDVQMLPGTATGLDGEDVKTLSYEPSDGGGSFDIEWSSDDGGVKVHGFAQDGDMVSFDPAVKLADSLQGTGASCTTTVGEVVVTSTIEGLEECPNYLVSVPWTCMRLTVDDGGAGFPFAGEWQWATDWGTSRWRPAEASKDWVLLDASWSP